MAKAGAKKIAARNTEVIRNLLIGTLLGCGLPAILGILGFVSGGPFAGGFGHAALWVLSLLVHLFAVFSVKAMGTPSFQTDPTGRQVLSYEGADLCASGTVANYYFDVIYLQWAVFWLVSLFSAYFWWLYVLPVGYALFKLWGSVIGPWISSPGEGGSRSQRAEPHGGANRRQRRQQ